MITQSQITCVGCDVAKDNLDVYIPGPHEGNRHERFENSPKGIRSLIRKLARLGSCRVCMECTGGHEFLLALSLFRAGIPVHVAVASRVADFGRSTGRQHKTDRCDARLLSEFLQAVKPAEWQPTSKERRHVRDVVGCIEDIKKLAMQTKMRACAPALDPKVATTYRRTAATLERQANKAQAKLFEFLDAQPSLKLDWRLLQTIKGIGAWTAARILAYLPTETFKTGRQLAAYAGTIPCHDQSGTKTEVPGQIAFACNHRLRRALWMPGLVATKHCPGCAAFADRLRKAGKAKKQVNIAVMRKLASAIAAVLKTKTPYDHKLLFSP
jgi:transposase